MKIPLVYFTASGNTLYASRMAKKGFQRQKIDLELIPIKRVAKYPQILESDIIGIASPVYEFNLSRVIRSWMTTIPVSEDQKKVFFIDTSGGMPCDSIKIAEEMMESKNYSPIGAVEIATPTAEPFFSNDRYHLGWRRSNLNRMYYFGLRLGRAIRDNTHDYVDMKIWMPGVGFFTRMFNRMEKCSWYSMYGTLGFRKERCTKCHRCEKACPRGAITISRKHVIDFRECVFCVTCVRTCPEDVFYVSYRPKAKPPKKDIAPTQRKGYIDPDDYIPPERFVFRRNILANF